jgi:hypothetical protein
VADIGAVFPGGGASLADPDRQLIRLGLGREVVDQDVVACRRQPEAEMAAEPLGPAGDDRQLAWIPGI